MKFSHALKFNANSAWKDHYINYTRIKKLIYKREAEDTKGMSLTIPDLANRTSIGMRQLSCLPLHPLHSQPQCCLSKSVHSSIRWFIVRDNRALCGSSWGSVKHILRRGRPQSRSLQPGNWDPSAELLQCTTSLL